MRESAIEKKVNDYAKRNGWLVYKFVSPAQAGVPDRLYIKNGKVMFIEFKAEGKKPTKLQEHHIEAIKAQGVAVYVVDSVEAGKGVIDNAN